MKKVIIYLLTIILGASIPIYFFVIWEPLKSKETFSNNVNTEELNKDDYIDITKEISESSEDIQVLSIKKREDSNSLFNYIDNERKEKLDVIIKKLSVLDSIKINDFFSDIDNNEKISKGIELAKIRMSLSDYEIFKSILENYIEPSFLK